VLYLAPLYTSVHPVEMFRYACYDWLYGRVRLLLPRASNRHDSQVYGRERAQVGGTVNIDRSDYVYRESEAGVVSSSRDSITVANIFLVRVAIRKGEPKLVNT